MLVALAARDDAIGNVVTDLEASRKFYVDVLNAYNQCWDAKNVFVTDTAAFTTAPFQNPGLSIMALSARAAHYIADEMIRRNL